MRRFSRWSVFEKAEVVFEKQLQENSCHPFHEVYEQSEDSVPNTPPVYVYSARTKRFYLALLCSIASLLFIIVWPSAGGDKEYMVFAVSAFALSVYLSVEYHDIRTIVIDPANEHYSVYRGKMLTATQHCHNIYIRLQGKKTGPRHPTYCLILDGCGLELPIKLCGETTNRKKLRHLAHELAANLHINYFDVHNSSKHHIIRHNRPHMLTEASHEE